MYEYSIEAIEFPMRAFKVVPRASDLTAFLDLINKKSEDGWELVTHSFITMSGITSYHCFICTFKREKK